MNGILWATLLCRYRLYGARRSCWGWSDKRDPTTLRTGFEILMFKRIAQSWLGTGSVFVIDHVFRQFITLTNTAFLPATIACHSILIPSPPRVIYHQPVCAERIRSNVYSNDQLSHGSLFKVHLWRQSIVKTVDSDSRIYYFFNTGHVGHNIRV